MAENTNISTLLTQHEGELLTAWLREQTASGARTMRVLGEQEARDQSARLIAAFRAGLAGGSTDSVEGTAVRARSGRPPIAIGSRMRQRRHHSPFALRPAITAAAARACGTLRREGL